MIEQTQSAKQKPSKKDIFIFILMCVTGILITVSCIVFKQSFLLVQVTDLRTDPGKITEKHWITQIEEKHNTFLDMGL